MHFHANSVSWETGCAVKGVVHSGVYPPDQRPVALLEECKVDSVGHRLIASIVRMEMIF
jgi:hypothetical protein